MLRRIPSPSRIWTPYRSTGRPASGDFLATFTAADSTLINGMMPDSGPNPFVVRSGSWAVGSNRAVCVNAGIATVNIERSDYTATGVVRSSHGSGSGCKIIVRYDPSNGHYYEVYVLIGSNAVWLRRYDGSFTTIATSTPTLALNTDHTVVVACSGSTITATVNGGSQVEATGATVNQTSTHIGMAGDSNGSVCLFDSLSVPAA